MRRMDKYMYDRMMRDERRRDNRDRYDSRDYRDNRDYYDRSDYYDYNDYHYQKKYNNKLRDLQEKLKNKDVYRLTKEDILKKAKEMNIKFDEYDEEEFVTTYYILASDYSKLINQPHTLIALTKAFLEDDDTSVSPSEKLYIYIDYIIEGNDL